MPTLHDATVLDTVMPETLEAGPGDDGDARRPLGSTALRAARAPNGGMIAHVASGLGLSSTAGAVGCEESPDE